MQSPEWSHTKVCDFEGRRTWRHDLSDKIIGPDQEGNGTDASPIVDEQHSPVPPSLGILTIRSDEYPISDNQSCEAFPA
jgi:hypothetical protein